MYDVYEPYGSYARAELMVIIAKKNESIGRLENDVIIEQVRANDLEEKVYKMEKRVDDYKEFAKSLKELIKGQKEQIDLLNLRLQLCKEVAEIKEKQSMREEMAEKLLPKLKEVCWKGEIEWLKKFQKEI